MPKKTTVDTSCCNPEVLLFPDSQFALEVGNANNFDITSLVSQKKEDGVSKSIVNKEAHMILFRLAHPNGSIITEIKPETNENIAVVEATVCQEDGKLLSKVSASYTRRKANALARRLNKDASEFEDMLIDLAQTKALTNALRAAGFGVQLRSNDAEDELPPISEGEAGVVNVDPDAVGSSLPSEDEETLVNLLDEKRMQVEESNGPVDYPDAGMTIQPIRIQKPKKQQLPAESDHAGDEMPQKIETPASGPEASETNQPSLQESAGQKDDAVFADVLDAAFDSIQENGEQYILPPPPSPEPVSDRPDECEDGPPAVNQTDPNDGASDEPQETAGAVQVNPINKLQEEMDIMEDAADDEIETPAEIDQPSDGCDTDENSEIEGSVKGGDLDEAQTEQQDDSEENPSSPETDTNEDNPDANQEDQEQVSPPAQEYDLDIIQLDDLYGDVMIPYFRHESETGNYMNYQGCETRMELDTLKKQYEAMSLKEALNTQAPLRSDNQYYGKTIGELLELCPADVIFMAQNLVRKSYTGMAALLRMVPTAESLIKKS